MCTKQISSQQYNEIQNTDAIKILLRSKIFQDCKNIVNLLFIYILDPKTWKLKSTNAKKTRHDLIVQTNLDNLATFVYARLELRPINFPSLQLLLILQSKVEEYKHLIGEILHTRRISKFTYSFHKLH
nr:hypothetical protein Iba_chr05eCG6040 [Ipomoea batatas]